jgi:hypothetical protein
MKLLLRYLAAVVLLCLLVAGARFVTRDAGDTGIGGAATTAAQSAATPNTGAGRENPPSQTGGPGLLTRLSGYFPADAADLNAKLLGFIFGEKAGGADIAARGRVLKTDADVEEMFAQTGFADAFTAMNRYFPQDAAEWRAKLIGLVNSDASSDEVKRQSGQLVAAIRRKHAPDVYYASDNMLKKLLAAQLVVWQALRDKDVSACNRAMIHGSAALSTSQGTGMMREMSQAGALNFEAMYEGRVRPQLRGPMRDELNARLFDELERILSEEDLGLLEKGDEDSPRTCATFMTFFKAIHDASFEDADILRADVVRSMLAG